MKYYLIVGEASGDLHASNLMKALQAKDPKAEFRFFGGDLMATAGGSLVKHYKDMAYMGFIPVLLHLRTIFRNMDLCKKDIVQWNPDVLILVDYPGFNLKIAEYIKAHTNIPIFYYISPKIWAWKEYRIKNIKRDVDELFSILPFEVDFSRSIIILFIMSEIRVWMLYIVLSRDIPRVLRNLPFVTGWIKSQLLRCWLVVVSRKLRIICSG